MRDCREKGVGMLDPKLVSLILRNERRNPAVLINSNYNNWLNRDLIVAFNLPVS